MPNEDLILYRLNELKDLSTDVKQDIANLWKVVAEIRAQQAETETKVEVNRARIMFFSTAGGTILGALSGLASSSF